MSQITLPIYLRSYIISDMYISIHSADAEVYSSREYAYHQQSFRAKRRNSEPSFWTSCGEDVSSLSPARLRLSSATLLSGVRPFPRNAPSVELLMGEGTGTLFTFRTGDMVYNPLAAKVALVAGLRRGLPVLKI